MSTYSNIVFRIPGHLPAFHQEDVCRELALMRGILNAFPDAGVVVCGDLWSVNLSDADSHILGIDPAEQLTEEASE